MQKSLDLISSTLKDLKKKAAKATCCHAIIKTNFKDGNMTDYMCTDYNNAV